MELRHLRYFTTLAETLSFTQAAESLFVSQSTLSQQIAALEQELGIKLFERTKRSVVLSDAGRAMMSASLWLHVTRFTTPFGNPASS